VHWNERWRGWIVTRYDDVYAALHNDRLMADTVTPYFQAMKPQDQEKYALIYDVLNNWTVFIDPPKHTRLRRLMQRAFTPRAISKMREVVEAIVTKQLDKWETKKQIDVIDDFAYPLPASVIATMIGAPLEDVHLFTSGRIPHQPAARRRRRVGPSYQSPDGGRGVQCLSVRDLCAAIDQSARRHE